MLRKYFDFYGIFVIVSIFSGWTIPVSVGGATIRLYDLMILTSMFIFPILVYREKFSRLVIFFYISLLFLYLKTCLFVFYESIPTLVIIRYCEIFSCFLVFPALISFMRPISVSRAIWIAAALNSGWVGIQIFFGINFGLYGFSSFGHFLASFSSAAVFVSLLVCLINIFPVKPVARVMGAIIMLGLIIGVLGTGSRTAVLAVMVYFFLSFIIELKHRNRWRVGMVMLLFSPIVIYFLDSFTGTMGDNDIISRFSNFSDSISVRFFEREFPNSVSDAFLGSPEKKHFLGYDGIGFNIDSVWFGALLNYGLTLFIFVFIPFSILAFRSKMIPYYFMLITVSSGIDLLSTMQVLAVFIIAYSLMVKFKAGVRVTAYNLSSAHPNPSTALKSTP